MGLRWFNVLGFVMLFLALFLNEVAYLNVWHNSNYLLVAVAIAYLVVALCLSSWRDSNRQHT